MNAGLAKALGVMMKLDFERAVLNRIPQIEAHPERYFRQVLFLCDEYHHFATVGESEPTGDEKFFSLSRQPKCIPIIATQSISSLKSALPGETWRTLLQTFRTKIFLALSDDFSARTASDLCGREDRFKVSYNLSESGHDARVSLLTGKALSHRANITASKSYSTQTDYRFDMKTFMELRNAQAVTIAYDGSNPKPPMFCYLKPYYNDPNKSYFCASCRRRTVMNGFEMILPFLKPIEHLILDDTISEVMVNGPKPCVYREGRIHRGSPWPFSRRKIIDDRGEEHRTATWRRYLRGQADPRFAAAGRESGCRRHSSVQSERSDTHHSKVQFAPLRYRRSRHRWDLGALACQPA